mgnify:CR=1 FL=1
MIDRGSIKDVDELKKSYALSLMQPRRKQDGHCDK